ncbi:hypothetical protein GGG16DRAFT_118917 [Schizophyllum commune]
MAPPRASQAPSPVGLSASPPPPHMSMNTLDPGGLAGIRSSFASLIAMLETSWRPTAPNTKAQKKNALDLAHKIRGDLAALAAGIPATDPPAGGNESSPSQITTAIHTLGERLLQAVDERCGRLEAAVSACSLGGGSGISPMPASASPPAPPPPLPPSRPRYVAHPADEVTVALPKSKSRFSRATPLAELSVNVETALHKVAVLSSVVVRGVRWKANGHLGIRVQTDAEAVLVLKHSDEWLAHFEQGCKVSKKAYRVLADSVTVADVDPSDPVARATLVRMNASVFEGNEESLLGLEWLLKDPASKGKARSTLVLTVASEAVADRLILSALAIGGVKWPRGRYTRPAFWRQANMRLHYLGP